MPSYEVISRIAEFLMAEEVMAAGGGSLADSMIYPRAYRKRLPAFLRALIVGFLMAQFVAPAVAERFELTQKETVALCFFLGFAGVRVLHVAEGQLTKRLKTDPDSLPNQG